MNTLKTGNLIMGELPDGSLGIQLYKTNEQYLHELTHTRLGKPRKNLNGKRLADAMNAYADFVVEKERNLSGD